MIIFLLTGFAIGGPLFYFSFGFVFTNKVPAIFEPYGMKIQLYTSFALLAYVIFMIFFALRNLYVRSREDRIDHKREE